MSGRLRVLLRKAMSISLVAPDLAKGQNAARCREEHSGLPLARHLGHSIVKTTQA